MALTPVHLPITYRCPEHISWTADLYQVFIVDEYHHCSITLQGVEAAIWSWLSLRYSYAKLVPLVAALLNHSPGEAEHLLRTTLESWKHAGLLVTGGSSDD